MNLESYFDALSLGSIVNMVSSSMEESVHLDFKLASHPSVNGDDRRNLVRAISGFANAAGGIIIWGVNARKGADGVDCAQEIVPISPINLFVSRLTELSADGASPTVSGVRHRSFPIEGNGGLAATLVPESASGPHMAKLGEDRYYKRNGTSFRKMEPFDLEDMFGRRQKPDIYLDVLRTPVGEASERIAFRLINTGRAIAKHYGIFVTFPTGVSFESTVPPLNDLSSINQGRPIVGCEDNFSVIHPNGVLAPAGSVVISSTTAFSPLELAVKIYCDRMMMKEGKLAI